MEEMKKNIEEKELTQIEKLTWEAPKLYNLKVDKTLGGAAQNYSEGDSYSPGPS